MASRSSSELNTEQTIATLNEILELELARNGTTPYGLIKSIS